MAQMLVLNPRKRRTRKKAKATGRRRRRRTVHAKRTANPVRRRRISARRSSRRRRRVHNPNPLNSGTFMRGATIAGAAVVTEVLANKLATLLPATMTADASKANMVRIGTKGAIAVVVPMLKFVPANIRNAIALGAAVATALDVLKTYVTPNIPGLSDYEQGTLMGPDDQGEIQGYEQGTLMGPDQGAYGGGAY